jgi:hypothetical protein
MFLSRSAHNQIVALYEARLKDAGERLADVERERDFYRKAWLERLGLSFPIPKPAEVTAISPSTPVTVPSEREERKTFKLDRFAWDEDDEQWYQEYWVKPALQRGIPLAEVDYWYYQAHGNRKPVDLCVNSDKPII